MKRFSTFMCRLKQAAAIFSIMFVCSMPFVCAVQSHTSAEKEALRVLSKHKALFVLIPSRVAQVLKVVRLHSHAAPPQRLDIIQNTLHHVRDKYRVVKQLRDTVTQVGCDLARHVRDSIIQDFHELTDQLEGYLETLSTTIALLDEEASELLVAASRSVQRAPHGRAHSAARDVLAPNHIDSLVDSLAGRDRAVSQMRQEVAYMRTSARAAVARTQQHLHEDFPDAMAQMSSQHSAATIMPTVAVPEPEPEEKSEYVPQSLVPELAAQSALSSLCDDAVCVGKKAYETIVAVCEKIAAAFAAAMDAAQNGHSLIDAGGVAMHSFAQAVHAGVEKGSAQGCVSPDAGGLGMHCFARGLSAHALKDKQHEVVPSQDDASNGTTLCGHRVRTAIVALASGVAAQAYDIVLLNQKYITALKNGLQQIERLCILQKKKKNDAA